MIKTLLRLVRGRGVEILLPPAGPTDFPFSCPRCGTEPTLVTADFVRCLICPWYVTRSEMPHHHDPANHAVTAVIAALNASPVWKQTKMSHWRCDKNPNFAIEVGYVHGECTIRTNRLRRGVDVGTMETVRGSNTQALLKELESIMRVIELGEKA